MWVLLLTLICFTGVALATYFYAHDRTWCIAALSVLAVAATLRFYLPALSPLHHDEGVNGYFLVKLFRDGFYRYNPQNYHGPTLYYFALAAAYLLGLTTIALRAVPAFFGLATVWLVLRLRPWIGGVGSITAAALVAVSPGAVYMSRYFIHESLFVFFTLAIVVAFLEYEEGKQARGLMLAALATALLFATKETAVISAAVLLASLAVSSALARPREKWSGNESSRSRPPSRVVLTWAAALLGSASLCALLYSSLLANPRGVLDALSAFKFWFRTGRQDHSHIWFEYLRWLWKEESLVLLLGIAGAAISLRHNSSRTSKFFSVWAFGILVTYSAVPYKTPWLTLNLIVPIAISGGLGIQWVWQHATRGWRTLLPGLIFFVALMFSAYRSVQLSFFQYDDDRRPYVYAHTRREFLDLVKEVDRISGQLESGRATTIAVSSEDYWPLPWYLRDYTAVGYFGKLINFDQALVIGSEAQEPGLVEELGNNYRRIDAYLLRPGIKLVLFARREIKEQAERNITAAAR
jgi:uncharacterized protein (TIGR03663 family)